MTYTDLAYLVMFLPIVVIIYNLLPQKHRWKVLLGASYVFFWSISGKLLIYLLVATIVTYLLGLRLQAKQDERNKKLKEVVRIGAKYGESIQ